MQMTLMELLGMERLQLQTSQELDTLRQEARAAQAGSLILMNSICMPGLAPGLMLDSHYLARLG